MPGRTSIEGIAAVTGATSGIGYAITLALAKPGWRLVLIARDAERLNSVAAHVEGRGAAATPISLDLCAVDKLEEASANLRRSLPRLDVLVHAAGRFQQGTIEELTAGAVDALFGTNVRAPWLLTRTLLPLLRATRGQVVVVNSSAVFTHPSRCGAYEITKAALQTFTNVLRAEVNADGVRVLSVFAGRTATPMQEDIYRAEGRPYHPERMLQPDDIARAIVNALALPRTAELTDLNIRPMMKA
ncbi:MAG: SDR family NAD(P)-dependent oxidoreductase [Vicinamibacteraceae bacterium]